METVEPVDILEPFVRAIMDGFGDAPLFQSEGPAAAVFHAYVFGALSALAVQKRLSPEEGFDIWKQLISRLFGYSADEARALVEKLVRGPDELVWEDDSTVRHGIAGFKRWQQQPGVINEVVEIFNDIVLQHMLCATWSGGSGESPANALVINTDSSLVGVQAEHAFIAHQCGASGNGWSHRGQRMHQENGRLFDVITVALSNGQERTFYFDITQFFGK